MKIKLILLIPVCNDNAWSVSESFERFLSYGFCSVEAGPSGATK